MILNGMPKAGNHALQKACKLLGVELPINHFPYAEKVAGERYIYIKRDPRDMLVTSVRFNVDKEVTPERIIWQIHNYMAYGPFVGELVKYLDWITDKDTAVIAYETLVDSPVGMSRLAEFIGTEIKGDEFEQLPGGTVTWEPERANWRDHWTPEVNAAWRDSGCSTLIWRMGYL